MQNIRTQFYTNLKNKAGLLISIGIGSAMGYISSNPIFGLFILIGGFIAMIFLCFPYNIKLTRKFVGKKVQIDAIQNLWPTPLLIGFAGLSQAGKSTLFNNLRQQTENARTQKTEVHIEKIGHPTKLVGYIDGPGNLFAEQFEILKSSKVMILLLDHNLSDLDISIDKDRLDEISNFNLQLRQAMITHNIRFTKIILVLNKRDLWSRTSVADKNFLLNWFKDEFSFWENGNFSKTAIKILHSNRESKDINKIISTIN